MCIKHEDVTVWAIGITIAKPIDIKRLSKTKEQNRKHYERHKLTTHAFAKQHFATCVSSEIARSKIDE